jgi:hypothetical protein
MNFEKINNLNLNSPHQVTQPNDVTYGPITWDRNGKSFLGARVNLDKYLFNRGTPVSAEGERLATWTTGLPGSLALEPGKNLSEFQAISVYRITTVIVRSLSGVEQDEPRRRSNLTLYRDP